MKEQNRPFEDAFEADPKLGQDLKQLYDFGSSLEALDRRVLDQGRRFAFRRKRMRLIRRLGAAAAVAAALVVGITRMPTDRSQAPLTARSEANIAQDIDRNGQVDIRDALRLARWIEAAEPLRPEWDLNRDGTVGQADVDAVAYAAVRLKQEGVL
ncbi:MAG: hypothetical protein JW828_09285 [Sedimentisphaerales bacterium]|nr:hypothetical protein [Sedimentisphaerales bacterium]